MYGYASRKTESEGVAGPLTAKALVIGGDDGQGPAVLLAVDSGAVPRDLRDEVYNRVNKRTPIAPERFVLCNSHCHSGPDLDGMGTMEGQQREHLERYAKLLTDRLVQIVEQALANRRPARLELARGSVNIAINRRVLKEGKWSAFGGDPDAPVDHEVAILKITGDDGKMMALLINYACHNTTLRGDFKQIHGDWAGSAQQFIEAELPGTTALITIGCGADSDPWPHSQLELCDKHGRSLADEVKRIVAGPWRPIPTTIAAKHKVLDIPWHPDPDMDVARKAAKQSWAVKPVLDKLEKGGELPEPRTFEITTWTFADELAMVFMSDEVVVDYVLRLKQELDPNRLWVSAYTNEVRTYIVTPRIIQEGGYESNNSLSALVTFGQPETLDPPMFERIIGTVSEMLPEAYRSK